jgi:hypothetical protein
MSCCQCHWTLFSLLMLGSCHWTPQAPAGFSGEFTAANVLERAVAAAGGETYSRAPTASYSRSRVQLFLEDDTVQEGTLQYFYQSPDRERLEVTAPPDYSLVQIRNGQLSSEWENGTRTGRDLQEDARRRRIWQTILTRFSEPRAEPPAQITSVREHQGREQVVLTRELGGEQWQLWVDAQSFLVTRISCEFAAGGQRQHKEDWLFEFRPFAGRIRPQRVVTLLNRRKVMESFLQEREENPLLDPSLFHLEMVSSDQGDAAERGVQRR